jgi:hypothetical protein
MMGLSNRIRTDRLRTTGQHEEEAVMSDHEDDHNRDSHTDSDRPVACDYDYVVGVQTRYTEYLMHKPYVVGVSIGIDTDRDGDIDLTIYCIVVLVSVKMPEESLAPEDRIPEELDGVQVRVQEVGEISAQASSFSAGG